MSALLIGYVEFCHEYMYSVYGNQAICFDGVYNWIEFAWLEHFVWKQWEKRNLVTVSANSDNYSYLMPVLRALIDKGEELLTIQTHLPNLPQTSMSPTFFDDFKMYVDSEEWDQFMCNIVSHFFLKNFFALFFFLLFKYMIKFLDYFCFWTQGNGMLRNPILSIFPRVCKNELPFLLYIKVYKIKI